MSEETQSTEQRRSAKGRGMDLVAKGLRRESNIFEGHDGTRLEFDVTAMREKAKAEGWEVYRCDIDVVYDGIVNNKVWEEDRVVELTQREIDDPAMAVAIPAPGGEVEHILIDGVHRIVRRKREGLNYALLWICGFEQIITPDPNWVPVTAIDPRLDWTNRTLSGGKIVER